MDSRQRCHTPFGNTPSRNAPSRNLPRPQAAEWSDLLVLDLRDLVDTLSEEEELVRAPTPPPNGVPPRDQILRGATTVPLPIRVWAIRAGPYA